MLAWAFPLLTILLFGLSHPTLAVGQSRMVVYVARHAGEEKEAGTLRSVVETVFIQFVNDMMGELKSKSGKGADAERKRLSNFKRIYVFADGPGRTFTLAEAQEFLETLPQGLHLIFGHVYGEPRRAASYAFLGGLYGDLTPKFIPLNVMLSQRVSLDELKFVTAYALAMDAQKTGDREMMMFYLGQAGVYGRSIKGLSMKPPSAPRELVEMQGAIDSLLAQLAPKKTP